MLKVAILVINILIFINLRAQDELRFFSPDSLKKTVTLLASDELKGRGNFTKEAEKAAAFIAAEFEKAGIEHLADYPSYLQPFIVSDGRLSFTDLTIEGVEVKPSKYYFNSSYLFVPDLTTSDFTITSIKSLRDENIFTLINLIIDTSSNPVLLTIPVNEQDKLSYIRKHSKQLKAPKHTLLIIITDNNKPVVHISLSKEVRSKILFNVIGVLPGKKLADEVIIISAHYDHLGGKADKSDSIFNGANDNASGIASMLSAAKYFSAKHSNERTIMFVAFAGEEIGLKGSTYLANWMNLSKTKAMFNLEMLGKPGIEGSNSLTITEPTLSKSDLARIMKSYCNAISITGYTDLSEKLFYRSDNAPFAEKRIPAHTFMCFSKGDNTYHTIKDETVTLDFENMSHLITGLLPGIEAVVAGIETPHN